MFITLTGEYQNVGDGVIRRVVLDWVRQRGGVTAYLAGAPDDWVEQMEFSPDDRVIRGGVPGVLPWLWRLATYRGAPILVTEPGEMTLARYNFPRQAMILAATLMVHLKGGTVVLPPRAVTRRKEALPWGPTLRLHRQISRRAAISLWRDQWSLDQVGSGELVPDTAFGVDLRTDIPFDERRFLFVSMRGARPAPNDAWYDAIERCAERLNLDIVVGAQVAEDDRRAAEIAARLGGEYLPWAHGGLKRESELRDIYDRTALAVADRLHVLILAAMSGAIPLEVVTNPTTKITSHFETVGVTGISLDSTTLEAAAISDWMISQTARAAEIREAMRTAHGRMQAVRARVAELFG